MDGLPSSEEGGEPQEYEDLEKYIYDVDREHDREITTSKRLWTWTRAQIRIIQRAIGTNQTEITNKAYSMGLREIRELIGDDTDEMGQMIADFYELSGNIPGEASNIEEAYSDIESFEQGSGLEDDWDLTEPISMRLKDSELSEAKDQLIDDALFGAWIHRAILALGTDQAKCATDLSDEKVERLKEQLASLTDESREYVESKIKNFVGQNYPVWRQQGISEEAYDTLSDIANIMDSEHSDAVQVFVEDLEQSVEENEEN